MITVRMPATSANLGPGFDCLGIALDWENRLTVEESERTEVQIEGSGSTRITRGAQNLALCAFHDLYRVCGVQPPSVKLVQYNALPVSAGLGSSAAAVVGALLAADEMLQSHLPQQVLLQRATALEGHSDNAAACLLGALVLSARTGEEIYTWRTTVHPSWQFVAALPPFSLSTYKSRAVLPTQYTRGAASANLPRVAMMIEALRQGDVDMLQHACRDALHQPYRMPLIADWHRVDRLARQCGAAAVYLSGAGPCLMSVCGANPRYEDDFRAAMAAQLPRWQVRALHCTQLGARIV